MIGETLRVRERSDPIQSAGDMLTLLPLLQLKLLSFVNKFAYDSLHLIASLSAQSYDIILQLPTEPQDLCFDRHSFGTIVCYYATVSPTTSSESNLCGLIWIDLCLFV